MKARGVGWEVPEPEFAVGGGGSHEGDVGAGSGEAVDAVDVGRGAGEQERAGERAGYLGGDDGALHIERARRRVKTGFGVARGAGKVGHGVVRAGPLCVGAGEHAETHGGLAGREQRGGSAAGGSGWDVGR